MNRPIIMRAMRNVIVKLSELSGEVRAGVTQMLRESDPELIGFPYKGRSTKGFIFNWKDVRYLIIDNFSFSSIEEEDVDDYHHSDFSGYQVDPEDEEE
jgi:hypothetical protein